MKRAAIKSKWMIGALSTLLLLCGVLIGIAQAQVQMPLCKGLVFSTEEDFLSRGPKPYDGNPIISDGDLLSRPNFPGPGVVVCARNRDLLRIFQIEVDLGLDAVDVIDSDKFLITFSTELDDPRGRFTAGDMLATNGAVLPNSALLALFKLPVPENIGLDSLQFVGETPAIIKLLDLIKEKGRAYWAKNPAELPKVLKKLNVDIWFSTEGTGYSPKRPSFLDGDLLSARDGTIVVSNANFLPALPAGLPNRGVDFGLDAFTLVKDPIEGVFINLFSTEINSLERPLTFTDGDILQQGDGIFLRNIDLIKGLEPLVKDVGLDALDIVDLGDCSKAVEIKRIGGIYVSLIDPITGYARKTDGFFPPPPPPADGSVPFDSPFGQWVSIRGNVPGPNCVDVTKYDYRIEYKEGAGPWIPIITHPDWQVNAGLFCPIWSWIPYQSNADGWIRLSDYWQAKYCAPDHALNVWNTSGKNSSFKLRLTLRQIGVPGSEIFSAEVPAFLDNIAPNPVQMALYDATGTTKLTDQCEVSGTKPETIITIKGQVRDEHFRMYELFWTGGDVHWWDTVDLVAPETPGYRFYDGGRPDLDGTGTLPPATTDVPLGKLNLTAEYMAATGNPPIKCGYTILLRAWDRTIRGGFNPMWNVVSDFAVLGWWTDYLQSFCFEPPKK